MIVGVLGIAINLDGPELVALNQQRHRAGCKRMRRGKVHGLAQNQIFRRLDVGINWLVRLFGATSQTGQRQRSAHHLKEAAPRDGIDPLLRGRRKLALHCGLKFGRVGQLIERAPILLALRALQLAAHLFERHGLGVDALRIHSLRNIATSARSVRARLHSLRIRLRSIVARA